MGRRSATRETAALGGMLLTSALACGRADLDPGIASGDAGAGGASVGGDGTGNVGMGATGAGATGAAPSTGGLPGEGGSGASGSGGSAPTCPSFDTPCTDCIATGCPPAWCDCYENPDCLGLFACYTRCTGDPACNQQCNTFYEGGISDAWLVSDCAGTTCDAACDWGDDATPCTECLLEDCSTEMNACFAFPACTELFACITTCPPANVVCQQGCYASFGDGTQALQDVLDCAAALCDGPCEV